MAGRLRSHIRDPLNLIALVAGLAWLAIAVFKRPLGDYGVETDFYADFVPGARSWMQGEPILNGFRGPLYYIVLGVLTPLFQDAFLAGKVLSAVAAAMTLRLTGSVLRRLFGPVTAAGGVLFMAANAHVALYAFRACTDLFFLVFFTGCLALLFTEPATLRRWAFAGLLAGAAWLTRYNGLALVPAAGAVALLALRPIPRAAKALGVFGAAWSALAVAWALFLWHQTGDPFWNTNFKNVATNVYTSNPSLAVAGQFWSAVRFESLQEVFAVDPARLAGAMFENMFTHIGRDVMQLVNPWWAAAALAGFGLNFNRWRTRRHLAFALAGFVVYVSLVPIYYNPRFMMPLLPWWAAGVGGLAAFLVHRFRKRAPARKKKGQAKPGGSWAAPVLFSVLTGLAVWTNALEMRHSANPYHRSKGYAAELIGLAHRVKATGVPLGPNTPIAARKPHIGYLLDAPVINVPFGGLDNLRESGACYLLVSGAEVLSYPTLKPLIWGRTEKVPSGLELVARYEIPVPQRSGARVASLYRVKDPGPWSPPERHPGRHTYPTLPGLNRLDTLRLQLARWYMVWEPFQDSASLLRKISPSGQRQPQVILARAEERLIAHEIDAAQTFYEQAAAADSTRETALLSIAACCYLKDDSQGFQQTVKTYVSGRDEKSLSDWYDLGNTLLFDDHYAAALTPFILSHSAYPDREVLVERMGWALEKLQWQERAVALYRDFLSRHPDSPRIVEALNRAS